MSWLNKIEPITLHQSSELPFVILKHGVALCFNNFYSTRETKDQFNLSFMIDPKLVKRQSTNYYTFKKFPFVVPFKDIIKFDNTIIRGQIIKHAHFVDSDPKNIAIVKNSFLEKHMNLESFVNELDTYNKSFILVDDMMTPRARLLEDTCTIIYHTGDYARTCTAMAHYIADKKGRKYCWTHSVPELSITCYGLNNAEEKNQISDWFEYIGVKNIDVRWHY